MQQLGTQSQGSTHSKDPGIQDPSTSEELQQLGEDAVNVTVVEQISGRRPGLTIPKREVVSPPAPGQPEEWQDVGLHNVMNIVAGDARGMRDRIDAHSSQNDEMVKMWDGVNQRFQLLGQELVGIHRWMKCANVQQLTSSMAESSTSTQGSSQSVPQTGLADGLPASSKFVPGSLSSTQGQPSPPSSTGPPSLASATDPTDIDTSQGHASNAASSAAAFHVQPSLFGIQSSASRAMSQTVPSTSRSPLPPRANTSAGTEQHTTTSPTVRSGSQLQITESADVMELHSQMASAKTYVCTVCNRGFRTANSLMFHALTHTDTKPHMCEVCGKDFISERRLGMHIQTHTVGLTNEASSFTQPSSRHLKMELNAAAMAKAGQRSQMSIEKMPLSQVIHDGRTSQIQELGPDISRAEAYQEFDADPETNSRERVGNLGRVVHTGETPQQTQVVITPECSKEHPDEYTCIFCQKKFGSIDLLQQHLKFSCTSECGDKQHQSLNDTNQDLANIREEHRETLSFRCTWCERRFCEESRFVEHIQWHRGQFGDGVRRTPSRPHPESNSNFANQVGSLSQRERSRQRGDNDPLQMHPSQCVDDEYDSRRQGGCHSVPNYPPRHSSEQQVGSVSRVSQEHIDSGRAFTCSVCGVQLASVPDLANHLMTHLDTKRYECDLCEEAFLQREQLLVHMSQHKTKSKEKGCTMEAEQASRTISSTAQIKEERTLRGGYQCMRCGRVFVRLGNFDNHVRVCKTPLSNEQRHLKSETVGNGHSEQDQVESNDSQSSDGKPSDSLDESGEEGREDVHGSSESQRNQQIVSGSEPKHSSKHPNVQGKKTCYVGKEFYKCEVCHKKLTSLVGFRYHMTRHGRMERLKCESGGENGTAKHQKKNDRLWCRICNIPFQYFQQLLKHNREIHSRGIPRSDTGSGSSAMKSSGFGRPKFVCRVCSKVYKSVCGLINHLKGHGEKLYKCQTCNKQFSFKKHLVSHQALHKPIEQSSGTETLAVTSGLYGHTEVIVNLQRLDTRVVTGAAEQGGSRAGEAFRCATCNKVCRSLTGLKKHRVIHFRHQCKICKKTFTAPNRLFAHSASHVLSKECKICKISFQYPTQLLKHRREVHTGLMTQSSTDWRKVPDKTKLTVVKASRRLSTCQFCKRRFKHRGHFIRHVHVCGNLTKVHHPKGPRDDNRSVNADDDATTNETSRSTQNAGGMAKDKFSCSLCGKEFRTADTLRHHLLVNCNLRMRKHTSIACVFCDRKYMRYDHFRNHIRTCGRLASRETPQPDDKNKSPGEGTTSPQKSSDQDRVENLENGDVDDSDSVGTEGHSLVDKDRLADGTESRVSTNDQNAEDQPTGADDAQPRPVSTATLERQHQSPPDGRQNTSDVASATPTVTDPIKTEPQSARSDSQQAFQNGLFDGRLPDISDSVLDLSLDCDDLLSAEYQGGDQQGLLVSQTSADPSRKDDSISDDSLPRNIFAIIAQDESTDVQNSRQSNMVTCTLCQMPFMSKTDLEAHMPTHEKRYYRCRRCNAYFDTEEVRDVHKRTHDTGQ